HTGPPPQLPGGGRRPALYEQKVGGQAGAHAPDPAQGGGEQHAADQGGTAERDEDRRVHQAGHGVERAVGQQTRRAGAGGRGPGRRLLDGAGRQAPEQLAGQGENVPAVAGRGLLVCQAAAFEEGGDLQFVRGGRQVGFQGGQQVRHRVASAQRAGPVARVHGAVTLSSPAAPRTGAGAGGTRSS